MQTNNDIRRNRVSFAILSAERSALTKEENDKRTETLRKELANLTEYFKPVSGFFEGAPERSFLVALDNGRLDLNDVQNIAESFNQDSILVLGEFDHLKDGRPAWIRIYEDATGRGEYIGTFKAVTEHFAKGQHAFTYDPEYDRYFTVV